VNAVPKTQPRASAFRVFDEGAEHRTGGARGPRGMPQGSSLPATIDHRSSCDAAPKSFREQAAFQAERELQLITNHWSVIASYTSLTASAPVWGEPWGSVQSAASASASA
jgi:hypothetical protein